MKNNIYTEETNINIIKLKDLYKNVINSIDNLIFFKDENFRYLGCNKAYEDFIGKTLTEMMNKTDNEVFGSRGNGLILDSKLKYIKQNSCYSESKWVKDKHKNEKFLHTVVSPMYDDGFVKGIVSNSTDLTKQKQFENIMVSQSKHAAMGEMIGMIAHQWRQPITAISMGANNMIVDIDLEEIN
ncbi:MAG: PAS domain S-box protein, partial [Campylobacteraceae bacterium]|nr:PAS domain S-box protein [Campylobacteraceae bacterium]